MVMSRGQDKRSQMHAMSVLLNTCSAMTNRVLIDDGARWILQGDEQERETEQLGQSSLQHAGGDYFAKELVKQGLSDRSSDSARLLECSQTCFSSSGHPLTVWRISY